MSRILGVRSVREKHDFSDFRETFFGGWQPPPDPATGFLGSLWMSRKGSGEFWRGPADAAHQGALNLGYIIEKPPKSTKIGQNFQNYDFPKIVPRHFLRVPRASAALWEPPWVSFRLVWWSHVTSPHYLKNTAAEEPFWKMDPHAQLMLSLDCQLTEIRNLVQVSCPCYRSVTKIFRATKLFCEDSGSVTDATIGSERLLRPLFASRTIKIDEEIAKLQWYK